MQPVAGGHEAGGRPRTSADRGGGSEQYHSLAWLPIGQHIVPTKADRHIPLGSAQPSRGMAYHPLTAAETASTPA